MMICMMTTASHLHRAKAMARSARRHHPQAKVAVCLVEKQVHPEARQCRLFDRIVLAKELEIPNFNQFILTRNIHEASYALKGHFLKHLFRTHPDEDRLIYLDTDIHILGPFAEVEQALERHPIVLTPHEIRRVQESYLFHGIFNIGFLALRRSEETDRFLDWWIRRTDRYCFDDYLNKGVFYEQNWLNAAPMFFDVHILDHPGYNVAFWNLKERKRIAVSGKGQYTVEGVPMRFFHFSHVNDWLAGAIRENVPKRQKGLEALRAKYLNELRKMGRRKWSKVPWSYDFHPSGKKITKEERLKYKNADSATLENDSEKHETLTIVQVLPCASKARSFPPSHRDSPDPIASDLAEGLVRQGHKVYLYAPEGSQSSADVIAYPRRLKESAVASFVARTMPDGVDLIHDHTAGSEMSRRTWPVPVVTTRRGSKARRARNAVYTSKRALKVVGKNKGTFVYNGIRTEQYEYSEEKRDYLLFMGGIVRHNGLLHAIEAAERTNRRLVIAGPVKDRKLFRTKIKPRIAKNRKIEYVGTVGGARKQTLLKHAQCVLFPSVREEPFGLAMMEAMACGTPVLAMAGGAASERLDGFPGLICRNADDMIAKVRQAAFPAPNELRAYAEERFAADRMVNGYLDVYRQKLQSAAGAAPAPKRRRLENRSKRTIAKRGSKGTKRSVSRPAKGAAGAKGKPASKAAKPRVVLQPRTKKKAA